MTYQHKCPKCGTISYAPHKLYICANCGAIFFDEDIAEVQGRGGVE